MAFAPVTSRLRVWSVLLGALTVVAFQFGLGGYDREVSPTGAVGSLSASLGRDVLESAPDEAFPGEARFVRGALVSHRLQCVYLLAHSKIERELDLSDRQLVQIQPLVNDGYGIAVKAFMSELPEDPLDMAAPVQPFAERCATTIEQTLSEEQHARLRQCAFQSEEGTIMFFHPHVVDALGLSPEAREKIATRLARMHRDIAPYRGNPFLGYKVTAIVAECRKETEAMLTADQRAALSDMLGEPAP